LGGDPIPSSGRKPTHPKKARFPDGPNPHGVAAQAGFQGTLSQTTFILTYPTIVIGGLIQETTSEDERKVPLLGDIPALGALFRSKQTAKEKKELVFFLTPTIVE
jgi:hypothetical protein